MTIFPLLYLFVNIYMYFHSYYNDSDWHHGSNDEEEDDKEEDMEEMEKSPKTYSLESG